MAAQKILSFFSKTYNCSKLCMYINARILLNIYWCTEKDTYWTVLVEVVKVLLKYDRISIFTTIQIMGKTIEEQRHHLKYRHKSIYFKTVDSNAEKCTSCNFFFLLSLSLSLSVCLSVILSVCHSVCLSVSLSLSFSLWSSVVYLSSCIIVELSHTWRLLQLLLDFFLHMVH